MRSCLVTLMFAFSTSAAFAQSTTVYAVPEIFADASQLYTISTGTGAATLVGDNSTHTIRAIAVHPITGVLWAITIRKSDGANRLVTLDRSTGAATEAAALSTGYGSIAITLEGVAYVGRQQTPGRFQGGIAVSTLNLSTGAATPVYTLGRNGRYQSLLTRNANQFMRIRYKDSNGLSTFDKSTGSFVEILALIDQDQDCELFAIVPNRVTMIENESTIYFSYTVETCRFGSIDLSTGEITSLGDPGFNIDAIAVTTTVPEPSAILGQLAAFATVLGIRRLRRH